MNTIIIDDTPQAICHLMAKLSQYPDIRVVATAQTGADGLQSVKTWKPDLIFLDVEMPDMSGLEFLEHLQAQRLTSCRVVVYTAFDKYMLQAFRNRAFDFLTKPVDDAELATVINRYYMDVQTHLSACDKADNTDDDGGSACENCADPRGAGIKAVDGKLLFYTGTADFRLVPLRDICAFAYDHDLRVWTVLAAGCEKPLRMKRNVNKEALLAVDHSFVQVSQKHIININYLLEVRDNICHFYPPFDHLEEVKVGRFFRRQLISRYNAL